MKTKEWTQAELEEMGLADAPMRTITEPSNEAPEDYNNNEARSQEVHLSFDPTTIFPSELIEKNLKVKDNFQKKADNPDKQKMPGPEELEQLAMEDAKHKVSGIGDKWDTGLSADLAGLMDALEQGGYQEPPKSVAAHAALDIIDLSLAYNHMFSVATKRALSTSVKDLRPGRKIHYATALFNQVVDEVRQFAVVARGEEKVIEAAQKIVGILNELSEKEYVTGSLVRLSVIKLVNEPYQLERYLVFTYPSLNADGIRFLDNSDSGNDHVRPYMVREGYLPNMRV